jgi:hypothetical protein
MDTNHKATKWLEIYKCAVLTIIAVCLLVGTMRVKGTVFVDSVRTPVEVTGEVDVSNSVLNPVVVEGTVDVGNTVEVEGTVQIQRY